jgi:phage shock protein A
MKLSKFFHHLKVKTESGLDKLISAEDRINTIIQDTEEALTAQVANAKKLEASRLEFNANLEKVKKEVTRFKTQCEVLKNKGMKPEDDELRIAAAQYLEHKKILDDLENQQKEIEKTWERVQKILKQLKLNKSLLHVKADALKTKIAMYKVTENITEAGLIDIDTTFNEVDEMVNRMSYENQASRTVDDLVNGKSNETAFKNAEIDDFLSKL